MGFRNKLNEDGKVIRNRERLVCKGYSQKEGIDNNETFAPIARIEVVRLFLAFATHKNYKVYQMDVKCAFLNGDLEEEVYIEQRDGFSLTKNKDMVCRLRKALYGLKQAPRAQYARLDKYLLKIGFSKGNVDSNLSYKVTNDEILVIEVFVDDIIFGGEDSLCKNFSIEMQKEFEVSNIGEVKFFLGFQISQTDKGILLSQSKHLKELLKKFGMENSKLVSIHMTTNDKLSLRDESTLVNPTRYKSMIGGLLYLTQTRPDIMNAVCIVSRFQSNPRENHESVVKRIFRYLQGTTNLGLWYPRDENFELCAYIDANWVGDVDDRKSTISGAFFLDNRLISWLSKKQSCTSLSIAESEYVAAATNCTQVLWLKQMFKDIKVNCKEPITIYCDNTTTIDISKNPILHSKTKHVYIKLNFLKENVEAKEVKLVYVNTKEQIVDIFTKPLPKEAFGYLRDQLGVIPQLVETQTIDVYHQLIELKEKSFTLIFYEER